MPSLSSRRRTRTRGPRSTRNSDRPRASAIPGSLRASTSRISPHPLVMKRLTPWTTQWPAPSWKARTLIACRSLPAIKVRAFQDGAGHWFVQGVKRFITNGCGEILLVLARSEPGIADARGLSLFLVERGPRVRVRRLEDKLGIHGSPTCELFFDDAPAKLIGERQRGLITYVMSLMNGARIGIAAQSLGIGEAAYRVARDYAHSRRQFETAIENFPAVRELLVDMSLDVQAARTLTYYAAFCVDIELGALRKLELGDTSALTPEAKKELRTVSRKYKGYNK